MTRLSGDWDDDPNAVALTDKADRCWQTMLDTTTPAGLALMLAAFFYCIEEQSVGAHFSSTENWFIDGDPASKGTVYALLPALWNSPAAAAVPAHQRARRARTAGLTPLARASPRNGAPFPKKRPPKPMAGGQFAYRNVRLTTD